MLIQSAILVYTNNKCMHQRRHGRIPRDCTCIRLDDARLSRLTTDHASFSRRRIVPTPDGGEIESMAGKPNTRTHACLGATNCMETATTFGVSSSTLSATTTPVAKATYKTPTLTLTLAPITTDTAMKHDICQQSTATFTHHSGWHVTTEELHFERF